MDLSRSFDAAKVNLRAHWRCRRMREFLARVGPPSGATVLDVGGSVDVWDLVDHRLHVTLFNTDEAHAWGFRQSRCADVARGALHRLEHQVEGETECLIVDDQGQVCLEAKARAEVQAIVDCLRRFGSDLNLVGFKSSVSLN